ncbi:MAG TPA: 50S ribosomal protein L24 [Planctomycetes bacterium]|nr:50S ribosomal protein L24 [Planctomycetota bacterium]HIJ71028.1 50S ribosomal protein L24 [Planctomycetota bacterium]
MARHIKKGDMVEIIAGDNKGSTGEVMRVIPGRNQVLVKGLNLAYKHVRPSRQNPQGGRIRVERPIDISNVLPVSPKSSRGSRVRFEVDDKGVKNRVAIGGGQIGVVTKAGR